ncbi:uncharacterized protein LOC132791520 isoform X1 [Drosophila nasuta]|uniref:Uncharacterized protein LOC117569840 n=1 Tax=Drosophila albomicans TaxID=7291 RepID=A0A6P8X709_DROAB|nr:uncharacterized protein LOC117569840 [Drosophila albomicans]XP_060656463.1 uncharacterized protein LOC132791520 isoform X1 [Drosophila nasuta]
MAKEPCTIKSWAIVIALINVFYSLIYMGIEIANVLNEIAEIEMMVVWIMLYTFNFLINLFFTGRKGDWQKALVVIWFIITSIVYILRLVFINYSVLGNKNLIFAICINVYIPFTLVIESLLYYQLANPTTDISSCLCGLKGRRSNVMPETIGQVIVEDLSQSLHCTSAPNNTNLSSCSQNTIRTPYNVMNPPDYNNVVAGQNTHLLNSKN